VPGTNLRVKTASAPNAVRFVPGTKLPGTKLRVQTAL